MIQKTSRGGGDFCSQARQGDVYLERVNSLPKGATEVPRDAGRIVLAYGEVTGHAHAISDGPDMAVLFQVAGDPNMYLKTSKPVTLRHEEHSPIKIGKGTFRIIRQREYVPGELPRNVAD